MPAKLSQLVTVINSPTSTYEDFLKVIKKNDYTRDILNSSRGWSEKIKLPYVITEAMLKFVDNSQYKGMYSSYNLKYKDIDYLYKNNEYLKEKIKMLDHVLQKVNPNEGEINYSKYPIFYLILNAFPVLIIDKFIKAGLDYSVKDRYGNNVLQYILQREKQYSSELFKYLINLPDIDINNLNTDGNSLLSLVCGHELYGKEYKTHNSKYINMFNILIRHPKIDINAGVPLLEIIDESNRSFTLTKNFYYFDILSKRSDLDINKRKKMKIKSGWSEYEIECDFFYYLANSTFSRESKEYEEMFNWCLNNNKINVNHIYLRGEDNDTILSSMVRVYHKEYSDEKDTTYAKKELDRIKKYLEIKKPKVTTEDMNYILYWFNLSEAISLRNIVKKSSSSSINQILDTIED